MTWVGNCCLYVSIDPRCFPHRRLHEKETLQSLQTYRKTRAKIHHYLKTKTLPFSHIPDVFLIAIQNNIWTCPQNLNPTQCFPLTSEPKPANSSPNQTACPLSLPLFFCDSRTPAFGRNSIGMLSVYQSPTPGLSGRVVNFLYVVITYGEELLVSATPAAYELLP